MPSTYAPLLADLKARVRAAQAKAAVAERCGAKFVGRLRKDLVAEFPETPGIEVRK